MANYSKLMSIAADFFAELNSEMSSGIPQVQHRSAPQSRNTHPRDTSNTSARRATVNYRTAKPSEGQHGEEPFRGSIYDDRLPDDEYGAKPMPDSPAETLSATEREYCERCIEEKDLPHPAITLDRDNLRNAIILSEILSPPVSKRFPRHR